MIRKMFRPLIGALAAAAALLSCGSITASADRPYENCIQNCRVYDAQGILTESELELANTRLMELSYTIDMYVAVYIYGPETSFSSDNDVMRTADDNYDALFNPQYGVDTDGILLLINNSTKYDYISTSGRGQIYFYNGDENNRVDEIFDYMWDHLLAGETYAAIEDFCTITERLYHAGPPDEYVYVYEHDTSQYIYMENGELVKADSLPLSFRFSLIPALPMGLIIGLIVCLVSNACIKNSYKFTKALTPTNYISQNETKFNIKEDMFIRQYRTRVRINSGGGSGGGGGGSSHRSSGGHSHGGGGRHR